MNVATNTTVRLLICDDHQLFCEGLKALLLRNFPNLEVLICNDIKMCADLLYQFQFDVMICDININGANGLNLIAKNQAQLLHTNVIVLSGYAEDYLIKQARQIGVNYFLKKEVSIEELIMAIHKEHPQYLPLTNELRDSKKTQHILSKQEREIVKLIIDGKLSKEIADILNISKTTVDTHRRNIHRKLNTSNSAGLLKLVYEGNIEI
jgi:DNA-binding NarL/FixJ family response regulator